MPRLFLWKNDDLYQGDILGIGLLIAYNNNFKTKLNKSTLKQCAWLLWALFILTSKLLSSILDYFKLSVSIKSKYAEIGIIFPAFISILKFQKCWDFL